jgi:cell division protein ZapA (FtsZ GTPase activity inhibitor)
MNDNTSPPNTSQAMAGIELLGKPYQIKCAEYEIPALQKAAEYLNNTLKTLPQVGRPLSPEKLGIMAALNLASRLLDLEDQMSQQMHFLNQRLHHLQNKLEAALNPSEATDSFRLEVESAQI